MAKIYTGIYTGIEFSNTPKHIRALMFCIAAKLKEQGWFLRTNAVGFYSEGGTKRSSFAAGIDMPLCGFCGWSVENMGEVIFGQSAYIDDAIDLMYKDILEIFPDYLDRLVRDYACDKYYDLLAAGVKLLGYNYDEPSKFLICYAPDEEDEQVLPVLYLAQKYHIPVFNLAHKASLDRIERWLNA